MSIITSVSTTPAYGLNNGDNHCQTLEQECFRKATRRHLTHSSQNSILCLSSKMIFKFPATIFFILVLLLAPITLTNAYITTLDAHAEECFFERAVAGTKLGFTFQVVEGGFLDIDVIIYDPSSNIVHKEDRATSGKYTIEANQDGSYKYCFSNKMSSVTPKLVMFSIETAQHVQSKASSAQESDKLSTMVRELTNTVISAKHELEYMAVRDKIHSEINESTNSRVKTWAFFEFILILSVSVGQVYFLQRFFETRRFV